MKIWFDTEFIDDGKTIDLISIGLVREDGHYYYALNSECNYERAGPWVQKNVLPHLIAGPRNTRAELAADIIKFASEEPEFWAYYADYDWVALCQLYGSMMQLPDGWPKFCMDVKQLCVMRGNPRLPTQKNGTEHHALEDARWTMAAWKFLQSLVPSERGDRKLDKEAQVGNTRFGIGVPERLVIERAQREFTYQTDPKIETKRIQRVRAFVGSLQDAAIGICPECGTHRFESPCPRGEQNCAMKAEPFNER